MKTMHIVLQLLLATTALAQTNAVTAQAKAVVTPTNSVAAQSKGAVAQTNAVVAQTKSVTTQTNTVVAQTKAAVVQTNAVVAPVAAKTSATPPVNEAHDQKLVLDPPESRELNRITLSARIGFNISARFGHRLNLDGARYTYLDGYVLPDSTGDFDPTGTFPGITQNWGYDNSARQRDGSPAVGGFPTVAMTRLASGGDPASKSFDNDPSIGAEVVYARRLLERDRWHFGVEGAANYANVNIHQSSTTSENGVQDLYQYFTGTVLPDSPTANGEPYQGRFDAGSGGPQTALISDSVAASAAVPVSVAEKRKFDADVWGFRVGPYVEYQLGRRWALDAGAGLAVAIVNGDASWSETLTVNGVTDPTHSGKSSDSDVMFGWYVGANILFHINERWDLNAGVQYQDVGKYHQNAGVREAELDLSKSLFVTAGVSWRF